MDPNRWHGHSIESSDVKHVAGGSRSSTVVQIPEVLFSKVNRAGVSADEGSLPMEDCITQSRLASKQSYDSSKQIASVSNCSGSLELSDCFELPNLFMRFQLSQNFPPRLLNWEESDWYGNGDGKSNDGEYTRQVQQW